MPNGEYRSRDRIDSLIIRMWGAFFIFAIIITGLGWLWVHDTTGRIERAEFGICHRLQIVRDNTNRNGAVIFEGIQTLRRAPGLGDQAKRHLASLMHVPQYQGRTNCQVAVDAPESYRPPAPQAYSDLPPGVLRAQLRP